MADTPRILTSHDLIIFSDEDGSPWLAFVWGEADPAAVAALITLDAIENEIDVDEETVLTECSWPPNVKAYWLHASDGDDDMYTLCTADHPEAQRVTGHRFYPVY